MVAKSTFRFFLLVSMLVFPLWANAGPKIQHWITDKGGQVFFVHAPGLPMIDLRVLFDAGSARDGEQFGVAALTSALLDTGTEQWDADAIAERLDQVGAELGTGASRDSAFISLRCLTRKGILDSSLKTLRQIIGAPSFNEKDFQREIKRLLVGLRHREESPGAIANIAYYKALYGDHPYAHPSSGFIDTVEPLTRDDLVAFYRRYYLASNATVVMVGDISRNHAESIAQLILSDLPGGSPLMDIPKVPIGKAANIERLKFPSKQTHISSGLPVLTRMDPDYLALYVGNHILGGSGLVSRISEEVREKRGLSYSAYSYFVPMTRKGPFTMGLQTRNDQADEAFNVLHQTVRDFIDNGPTAEELDAAKKNISGGFVLRYDSNRKLAEYVGMIAFYRLPLDYLDTFTARVLAVTRENIKDAFVRRVQPEQFQTVMVGGDD